jgi:ribonucleoside-diphosphate reductase alpha chain
MGPGKVLSVPDAVGIALERFMADKQGVQQDLLTTTAETAVPSPPVQVVRQAEQMQLGGMKETLAGACPDCGSQLEFAEGCMKCHICGYSECG